ncbi:hypothetical protein N7462_005316 [Penicillium macrosclerotiorum]|uniref:uncharacterized protein n=1 Tax=Penicillium macrosclerotiorum TaxID=303699 RepID=UPI0025471E7B|nr:uncharacterized protein N7462_005316 [Penicillium macrosclerotiorum]KAJ5682151.1 hypothetical protein N7462_005316 [Penicillium macrosclerotiorum]
MTENQELDIGLAQLLEQKMKLFADRVCIEHGSYKLTFWELHCKALMIVRLLYRLQIRKEEPIAILARRGVDHILSQVAVVYAGGSCVPLDVDLDDRHIRKLVSNLGVSVILVDLENQKRLSDIHHILVDHVSVPADVDFHQTVTFMSGSSGCSHILHTSGSTGLSKAVQVLAKGLINLVLDDFVSIHNGCRVAHVCNVGFDVSLWEIWSSLLQGGTIVTFERHEMLDPFVFEQKLKCSQIDVIWQTTSLLATIAHVCPYAYSYVDTLLTGGEAINIRTIRSIVAHGQPRRLFNIYGPTELTAFTTYHQITPADIEKGHIPIGRPLKNFHIQIVDENLQPVPNGNVGELLVGGVGVTGGYINQPEKTARAFVYLPHLTPPCETSNNKYYRTGDLVQRNNAGILEFVGRQDHQVKIRGQRVDLESIEWHLLETGLVSCAVAQRVTLEDEGSGSFLLACVTPVSLNISAACIRQAYIKLAPHLMIPRLQLLEVLPLTCSGKVDRKKLVGDYMQHLRSLKLNLHSGQESAKEGVSTGLGRLWQELLGIPVETLQSNDDFFLLGGTSLQAALLASKIQKNFGIVIHAASLFEYSTLQGMRTLLCMAQNKGFTPDRILEMNKWLQDCQLGKDLEPLEHSLPDWTIEAEGKVFLTGATGFVGAFLLAHILTLPHVKEVACLVRAHDPAHALVRIRKALRRYGLIVEPKNETKILALPGDLAKEHIGIGRDSFRHFAQWASVIFHCGAHINFVQPYLSHRTTNIVGTLNMIQFAVSGRSKAIHYTSSISAYGPTGVITGSTNISENERPISHVEALFYDTGYAQSKFVAENIIWHAIDKGIPIAIHRLGLVLGPSTTGAMNTDDFLSSVIKSSIQTGRYPILPRHRGDFVPIDFVISCIVHIASNPVNLGQAYNILHPDSTSSIYLPAIFDMINNRNKECFLRGVSYQDWVNSLSQMPDHYLGSLMPMLMDKVYGNNSRWELQRDMPKFSRLNTRRALANDPDLLHCESPSTLIARYIPHWLKSIRTG